jgi:hypothetical protein
MSTTHTGMVDVVAFLVSGRFSDRRVMLAAAVDQWPDMPLNNLLRACELAGGSAHSRRRQRARQTSGAFWWNKRAAL